MKFELQGLARFKFTLTSKQLEILERLAKRHYDMRCRMTASTQHDPNDPTCGIIHAWRRTVEEWDAPIYATESEIDILQKVLEGMIETDDEIARHQLQRSFSKARNAYRDVFDKWRIEVDTDA